MSMNLNVSASGVVKTPSGQDMPFHQSFQLWQTRTEDTYKILESKNILKTYISMYKPDHEDELKIWLKNMQGYGFEIKWFAM
jgi:hypothetical protein